jgi:hypothetical protein
VGFFDCEPSSEFKFYNQRSLPIVDIFEIDILTFSGKSLLCLPVIMPCTISLIGKAGNRCSSILSIQHVVKGHYCIGFFFPLGESRITKKNFTTPEENAKKNENYFWMTMNPHWSGVVGSASSGRSIIVS